MEQQYATPLDQAWLKLWVDLYPGESLLARYIDDSHHEPSNRKRHPKRKGFGARLSKPRSRVSSVGSRHRRADFKQFIEGLDDCFDWLKALRLASPAEHGLISEVGAIVSDKEFYPDDETLLGYELPAQIPGITAISFPRWEDVPKGYLQLAMATSAEVKQAWDAIARGGKLYEVSLLYTLKGKPKQRGICWFYVELRDGNVSAVKVKCQAQQVVGRDKSVVWHNRVGYPDALLRLSKKVDGVSVEETAAALFKMCVRANALASDALQVNVQNGAGRKARFFVPRDITASFFRDRELIYGGRRIFHAVKGHIREVGDQSIDVRPHYRGERRFSWFNYEIKITVPGFHHKSLDEFRDIGSYVVKDDGSDVAHNDWMDLPALGKALKKYMWDAPDRWLSQRRRTVQR